MNENGKIPVPDPFSEEYEYFFPSALWNGTDSADPEKNTDGVILPYLTDPDFRLYE